MISWFVIESETFHFQLYEMLLIKYKSGNIINEQIWKFDWCTSEVENDKSLFNPTWEGVQIPWIGGGGAKSAPPPP